MHEWLARALGAQRVAPSDPERVDEVERVLAEIAPMLSLDGGGIELVSVEDDGTICVRMRGACEGCSQQTSTLSHGLEPRLRAALPWFRALRTVT
ncbi:MAG: NifU family protein [Planctomycetes bacterium]|nr:NifU family protein [Planctomycetota bacterium]